MRRGVIWVAAVLYTVIGMIAIGLLLTAALPSIEKLRDRNTFTQTKELFFTIDSTVRTVALEGTASQRELNPLIISKGSFVINATGIHWTLPTEALIVEPSIPTDKIIKQEGNLQLWQEQLSQRGQYIAHIDSAYDKMAFRITPDTGPLLGTYSVTFKNSGELVVDRLIIDVTIR